MYRSLDAEKIVETVRRLRNRIKERFPTASLGHVAEDLLAVAEKSPVKAGALSKPHFPLRIGIAFLVIAFLTIIIKIFLKLKINTDIDRFSELLQAMDAALNTVILLGGAIFFLFTMEIRLKRNRALKLIHELRSLAHIVDMHQLTKDPETIEGKGPQTASSPKRSMTRFELSRYLDYCSEMSSLIGKIAALYVQEYDDPVVLSAVDQIEDLTSSLSRKAWQKIMINNQLQTDPNSQTGFNLPQELT
ncbi:hypothetical protein [Pedosphaera parvula]|uniref:Uncharacterized protein n=1 Tax=Pedosphaera parvula (strain Ellin514) TaxID=320771 RepID=B9XI44_PEDPL|nr:hypothetical protein [Pedosphaera parvula]EEF60537.1 conserved hypothetical protein [Pedosphaera parvula Ellin514]